MSVGLYKYDGDFYDRNSELVLSENIASERFYNKYWEKAINELNVKYIQDGAEINFAMKDKVLKELELLLEWAIKNVEGKDLQYMKDSIENLQKVIPTAFDDENTILYIF